MIMYGLSSNSSSDEDSQPVPNVDRASNSSSTTSLDSALRATAIRSSKSPQMGTVRTSSTAFDFEDKEDTPPPSVKRSKMSPPSS
ncbi:hypothetical protein NECAME_06967, partial [Necator americanus]